MAREEPSALALKLIEEIGKFCQIFGIGESRADEMLAGIPGLAIDGDIKLGFSTDAAPRWADES